MEQENDIPLVSVIITTFGDASVLPRAIKSVLNQEYKNIEVIVVDDNSPSTPDRKQTEKIMAFFNNDRRITYICHEHNLNGSAARNTGLNHALGEYITFLDNDDVMLPHRISEAISALNNNHSIDVFFCSVAKIDMQGHITQIINIPNNKLNQKEVFFNDMLIGTGSNLFFRRKVFEQIGQFDTRFKRNQDIEYLIRIFRQFQAISTSRILLIKGLSNTNNAPSYDLIKRTKQLLYSTFEDDYSMMTPDEQHAAKKATSLLLWRTAVLEQDHNEIEKAKRDLSTHISRRTMMAEQIKLNIKRSSILRSVLLTARDRILRRTIDKETYNEIVSSLKSSAE